VEGIEAAVSEPRQKSESVFGYPDDAGNIWLELLGSESARREGVGVRLDVEVILVVRFDGVGAIGVARVDE
jgi:hypothetical protein